MSKQLLLGREYQLKGSWYAPLRKLESYKSVIKAKLVDTMSSAGDWRGIFLQKAGNYVYAIAFSQENNFPWPGFTLFTPEKPIFRIGYYKGLDLDQTMEEIVDYYLEYCD
jgi:hypothetical protein